MILALINLISCASSVDFSMLYMTWAGNWSISHEQVLVQNSNSHVHVNDYWATITKKSIGKFDINIFESPNNTNLPISNYSVDFNKDLVVLTDNENIYSYHFTEAFYTTLTVSGKYQKYTFHFIVAGTYRYQLSVFDFENNEWNFYNIIKDVERHDPTWFEENFWMWFGYIFLSIFLFVLYNFTFRYYSKIADEENRKKQQEKKLPKQEFEDVLTPGYAKRRTPMTYGNTD